MFKNLKNLLVGIFSAVIVIAVGASAYTALASPGADEAAAQSATGNFGNGNGGNSNQSRQGQGGQRQGQGGQGQSNQGQGNAVSGINLASATTLTGTVTAYDTPTLTVLTTDGQTLAVQLGNARYASSIGFNPQVGQTITVYGFSEAQGLFSAITVTLDGQVYILYTGENCAF